MSVNFDNRPMPNLPVMALVSPISWTSPLQEDSWYRQRVVWKLVQAELEATEDMEGEERSGSENEEPEEEE